MVHGELLSQATPLPHPPCGRDGTLLSTLTYLEINAFQMRKMLMGMDVASQPLWVLDTVFQYQFMKMLELKSGAWHTLMSDVKISQQGQCIHARVCCELDTHGQFRGSSVREMKRPSRAIAKTEFELYDIGWILQMCKSEGRCQDYHFLEMFVFQTWTLTFPSCRGFELRWRKHLGNIAFMDNYMLAPVFRDKAVRDQLLCGSLVGQRVVQGHVQAHLSYIISRNQIPSNPSAMPLDAAELVKFSRTMNPTQTKYMVKALFQFAHLIPPDMNHILDWRTRQWSLGYKHMGHGLGGGSGGSDNDKTHTLDAETLFFIFNLQRHHAKIHRLRVHYRWRIIGPAPITTTAATTCPFGVIGPPTTRVLPKSMWVV